MKYICSADFHITPSVLEIADLIEKQLVDLGNSLAGEEFSFVIAGDTLHTKNVVYETARDRACVLISNLSKIAKVYLIIGNHDWSEPYRLHPFTHLKGEHNIVVVDEPVITEDAVLLPYYRERERMIEALDSLSGKSRLIFGHFDVKCFKMSTGKEEIDAILDSDDFKTRGFRTVISGHIHLPQEHLIDGVEVISIGSPHTTDRGESNQEKRFIVYDTSTKKRTDVNTNLTLHKTIHVSASDGLPTLPVDDLEKGVKFFVKVSGTAQELEALVTPRGYQAVVDRDYIVETVKRIDINFDQSTAEIVEVYSKYLVDEGKLSAQDSEMYKKTLLGWLRSAA